MASNIAISLQLPRQDWTGCRFGRWRVIRLETRGSKARLDTWLCRCDCGNEKPVALRNLTSGDSKSCGCLRAEMTARRFSKRAYTNVRINGHKAEYNSYIGMIARGTNPDCRDYAAYGAVGRGVCDRWIRGDGTISGFECFLSDMGPRPPRTSLDRINNDEGYSPSNCRWATASEQARNRRPRARRKSSE